MKKSFYTCPRCSQLIKIESEGEVLAVKHPMEDEPLTSDQENTQTNQGTAGVLEG